MGLGLVQLRLLLCFVLVLPGGFERGPDQQAKSNPSKAQWWFCTSFPNLSKSITCFGLTNVAPRKAARFSTAGNSRFLFDQIAPKGNTNVQQRGSCSSPPRTCRGIAVILASPTSPPRKQKYSVLGYSNFCLTISFFRPIFPSQEHQR